MSFRGRTLSVLHFGNNNLLNIVHYNFQKLLLYNYTENMRVNLSIK